MSLDVLFIAGEHSGDEHAARLIRKLRQVHPEYRIYAVGGPAMKDAGATLLFDLTQWAVVGLVEVLKHYGQFKHLLTWIVQWVRVYRPRMVCLVDFPGFNLRLAKALYDAKLSRKAGGQTLLYAYISPQIWAWKKRRRFVMARYLDSLGVIFPFEKDCFRDTHLDVHFVGHPLIDVKAPVRYERGRELLLLPGSRPSAVQRIFPLLLESYGLLSQRHQSLLAVVIYPDTAIRDCLLSILKNFPQLRDKVRLVDRTKIEKPLPVSSVLMSSGTASLQMALAGIPGVIVYRTHPLTFFLGKKFVQIPYLGMANILMQDAVYPEVLQNVPRQAEYAAKTLEKFLEDPERTERHFSQVSSQLHDMLQVPADASVEQWVVRGLEG